MKIPVVRSARALSLFISLLLIHAYISIGKVRAFTSIANSRTPKYYESRTNNRVMFFKQSSEKSSSTQLNWGVLVPVPDDFFTITGISIGFAYTILRSWNRVTLENVAWENRLQDARMAKLDDDLDLDKSGANLNTFTELDLRKMDAESSISAYGPDAMSSRDRRRRGRRVQTMDREDDYNDEEEDTMRGDRMYSMTDEQILEFEEKYGIEYDPYYDEPYTEDELPDDMTFVEDKVYGDRRYENGDIFYRDENNKSIYWRQGGRPRLKQLWEFI